MAVSFSRTDERVAKPSARTGAHHGRTASPARPAAIQLALDGLLVPLKDQAAQPFLIYVALMVLAARAVVAATGLANLSRTHPNRLSHPERR